jgi:uncharacterized protein YjbI with pentapeptide repeats
VGSRTSRRCYHESPTLTLSLLGLGSIKYGLGRADLAGADLGGAIFIDADLDSANLTDARWPGDKPVPEGWKLGDESLLEKADANSQSAGAN